MKGKNARGDDARRTSSPLRSLDSAAEHQGHELLEAEYNILEQRQNLGWLGRLFGANTAAPTNIAGLVILLCFLFFGASLILPSEPELAEARKLAFAIISSGMAYIFGAASKK